MKLACSLAILSPWCMSSSGFNPQLSNSVPGQADLHLYIGELWQKGYWRCLGVALCHGLSPYVLYAISQIRKTIKNRENHSSFSVLSAPSPRFVKEPKMHLGHQKLFC